MNFLDFCRQWIIKNLSHRTVLDEDLERDLIEIAMLIDKQNHSGAQYPMFVSFLNRMLTDELHNPNFYEELK